MKPDMSAFGKFRACLGIFLACALCLAAVERLEETFGVPLDHKAILYNEAPLHDPATRLIQEVESGKVKLAWERNGWGYLRSLLEKLDIRTDSQVLVFSQTSIQIEHISSRTPRAIYFNDAVSVGYVQNGDVLEISSLDPKQGIIFYTLKNRRLDGAPDFARRDGSDDCMRCHRGPQTLGIPGRMVSSVYASASETRARVKGTSPRRWTPCTEPRSSNGRQPPSSRTKTCPG